MQRAKKVYSGYKLPLDSDRYLNVASDLSSFRYLEKKQDLMLLRTIIFAYNTSNRTC